MCDIGSGEWVIDDVCQEIGEQQEGAIRMVKELISKRRRESDIK